MVGRENHKKTVKNVGFIHDYLPSVAIYLRAVWLGAQGVLGYPGGSPTGMRDWKGGSFGPLNKSHQHIAYR